MRVPAPGAVVPAPAVRGLVVAAVLATLASCYSPSYPNCTVACGAGGACPSDTSCGADGFCHASGAPLCGDHDAAAADAGRDAAPATDATPAFCGNGVAEVGELCYGQGTVYDFPGAAPSRLALGQFAGDPGIDVAFLSGPDGVTILRNELGGLIVESVIPHPGAVGLIPLDRTGDGDDELVLGDVGALAVVFLEREGVQWIETPHDVPFAPVALVAAFLDGDGLLDLAVASDEAVHVVVDVAGSPSDGNTFLVDSSTRDVVAVDLNNDSVDVDLNNDSLPELLTVSEATSEIEVLSNDGGGNFGELSSSHIVPGASPPRLLSADLDLDDDVDLVVPRADGGVSVLFADGDGGFGTARDFATSGVRSVAVAAADLDRDGDLDLVVADDVTNRLYLLTNQLGDFTLVFKLGTYAGPRDVAIADLDADGSLDLVVATDAAPSVSVFFATP